MQQVFGRWLQYAYSGPTAVFELKRTLTKSLAMSEVKSHQVLSLEQVKTGFYYKIPDDTIAAKPFDCIYLKKELTYIVVGYGIFLKGFYLIPAHFILTWQRKGLHSITEKMAEEVGQYIPISRDNSSDLVPHPYV